MEGPDGCDGSVEGYYVQGIQKNSVYFIMLNRTL